MDAKIFRINYKSDFILTLVSDAGWMTPFCIKFWTGAPSQAYYAQFDGTTYTHCAPVEGEPTKLTVQFDDHHLPIGNLKYQVAYHFTVADFPNDTEDEVLNQANITTEIDGEDYQVMLDLNGDTAPEIQFALPAYANEAQRISNEQQRIQDEETRIANEETRQENEAQRIAQETARVNEFATLKSQSQAATRDANDAATLANQKAQLAADKAALADDAATLANAKAQLAADKAALANDAAQLANEKAALAQQKAEYAQQQGGYAKDQGDYAKNQGNYAKEQGDTAIADHQRAESDHGIAADDHTRAESDHGIAVDDHTQAGNDHTRAESDHGIAADDHTQAGNDHTRAESDHGIAADDHTQAGNDHTRAESDHGIAADDHTQAGNDHTRAESDHTRAESDHAAVEVYVDSLGAFDISAYHATGGVLAKYADLTAALGTNGANIPDALRKGGMSVKFVQSSDNKYVQYRLMSDTFNTTSANWQGVDDEPTAGSDNLVKSGGAEKAIQEVKGCDVVNYTWNSINESIAVANLVLIGSVSVGDKVNLKIKAASSLNQTSLGVGLITKTNAQLGANSLDFGNQDMSIERSGTITVATASQEAYIVCWMTGGTENIDVEIKRTFNYTGNETIATLDKRVSDNEPIIENHQEILDDVTISKESKNRFDSEWSEPGKNINYDTGLDQDGTTQRRTGFVAVKSETNYTLSCVLVDAPSVIVFYYDENKQHISTETTAYGFYPKTITTPANCKFIRVTHGSGGMPTDYQIEEGNEATSYEPYQPDSYKVPKSAIDGSVFDIENKNWLFLGDSITAMTGATSWVNKFKSLVKSNEQSFNQAVGGAKWCDDEQGITYNGKPYESQNYIGNQVAWVQRVGITAVDLDAIIIAAGTNDDNVTFPSDSDIESAFYASGSSTLIPLENVDRSTWQGAIRWTVQTLRELFPNAKIFLVTPLQRMSIDQGQSRGDMYPVIKQKRETIIKMAKRMSIYLIDTSECNISDMQSGMYADGLHLSVAGSTVMSKFVYNSIKNWF